MKNTELNVLPVYDDRYIKIKIRTYVDKVYANLRGLNVPEDDIEYKSFKVTSINSLPVYDKISSYILAYMLHPVNMADGGCKWELIKIVNGRIILFKKCM